MKDLAKFLLSHLVTNQEAIEIDEQESDDKSVTLTLKVAKEDMGKIIGKQGKTIRAIRDVIKILALKQDKYVNVVLVE